MVIIAIIALALILLLLLAKPKRVDRAPRRRDRFPDTSREDGIIYGETPDGIWHGGPLPDDFTPGGGDFGGGGSSGGWSDNTDPGGDSSSSN